VPVYIQNHKIEELKKKRGKDKKKDHNKKNNKNNDLFKKKYLINGNKNQ